jgi:hypothetical protein
MLVTSSASLTNCLKETAVFSNSETPFALPAQSLHILNDTLKSVKLIFFF